MHAEVSHFTSLPLPPRSSYKLLLQNSQPKPKSWTPPIMKLHLHETDFSLQKKRTTTQTHQTRAPHPKPKTQKQQQHQQSINLCSLQPADQSPRKKKNQRKPLIIYQLHYCTSVLLLLQNANANLQWFFNLLGASSASGFFFFFLLA